MSYKVLIADSRFPAYDEEKDVLEKIGAEVVVERSDDEETLAALVGDVDGLIVNLAPVTAGVIGAMTRCKCISRYGVGYDNVDIEALKGSGIILANVPDYCAEDVSDHAMALFLDCARKTSRKDRHVRQGEWNLTGLQPVHRIAGSTFGLVGYGMIARNVHRKLRGFDLGGCWSPTRWSRRMSSRKPVPKLWISRRCWPSPTTFRCTPRYCRAPAA